MGGCDMDLRRAEIDGPEVVISAVAFWGGVKITVPEGFDAATTPVEALQPWDPRSCTTGGGEGP